MDAPSAPCTLGYPERFEAASSYIHQNSGGKNFSQEAQLLLYGLGNQVIKGPCNQPKPGGWGWGSAQEVAKWQSWKGLGDMNSMEAMRLYVRTVEEEQPNWFAMSQQSKENLDNSSDHSKVSRPAVEYATSSSWVNIPHTSQRTPLPRYEHAAAMLGQSFCVVGGNCGGRYLNDVWKLNIKTMEWSQVQTKPFVSPSIGHAVEQDPQKQQPALPPIAGHTVTAWNDTLVIIGGHTKVKDTSLTVQVMDLAGEVAKLAPGGNLPPPRGSHTASLLGRRIYVFGGEDPHRRPVGDLWYLDLDSMSWGQPEVSGKPPSPRSAHAAAVYENRYLIVFGGGSVATCLSDVHVLDTHAIPMTWSQPKVSGLKVTPRAGHTGVVVGSVWYLVGGGNNVKGCTDMLALDLKNIESGTVSWSSVASIPIRDPLSSEGISLAVIATAASPEPGQPQEYVVLSFGGYNGKYQNSVSVIKLPDCVPAAPLDVKAETNSAPKTGKKSAPVPALAAPAAPAAPPLPPPVTDAQLLAETRTQLEAALRDTEAALKEAAGAKENAGHELALLRKQLNTAHASLADAQKDTDNLKLSLSREREKVMKLEAEIAELKKKLGVAAELQKEVESLRRTVQEAESKKSSGGVWGYISGQ